MPIHRLGPHWYDIWEGPEPPLIHQQVAGSVRPGVNGAVHAFAGAWAEPFEVELTTALQFYVDAFAMADIQRNMIGYPWGIIKDQVNYTAEFLHVYRAIDCKVLRIKQDLRFIGPDKNYSPATLITTRWLLFPINLMDT